MAASLEDDANFERKKKKKSGSYRTAAAQSCSNNFHFFFSSFSFSPSFVLIDTNLALVFSVLFSFSCVNLKSECS
jgi:hypothetical protein